MDRIKKYVGGLSAEVRRIVWPSGEAIARNSANAVGVMLVSAAAIFGLDQLAQLGLKAVMTLVG